MTTNPWPIIGHERAVERLARAVTRDEVAHAYLFSGPDGIGKRTLACTMAQALLCTAAPDRRPCGECRGCDLVRGDRHPDVTILDMAWQATHFPSKKEARAISVDSVRRVNSELTRRPHEGARKLLIVPGVEEMTTSAANAFLKTLEEPPAHVVILLTTRDTDLVLPTIRSRCQPVPLRPLPVGQVERALRTRWGIEDARAALLARLSGGRIGEAIAMAGEEHALEARDEALALLGQALAADRADRLLLAAQLARRDDPRVLQLWAGWWRDLLLIQNGSEVAIANVDQRAALESAATRYPDDAARTFLRDLLRLFRLMQESNANRQLLWEVVLLKLPHPATATVGRE